MPENVPAPVASPANADKLLDRAKEHCFLAGVGDIGEQLCAANQPFGIAKIHWAQRALGYPSDATFVGAPDATVTRNVQRWKQGFGYGGRIQWTGDFAVLDIKSNGCGMLVGELPEVPPERDVLERAGRLVRDGLELEGISIDYDLDEGNHFLDVCQTTDGQRAFFVMHSSGHEHRASSPFGCGMYYDADPTLAARATVLDTPWGSLSVLTGDDASWWFDIYMRQQAWNHRRRAAIASALFDEWTPVVNATHQGLTAMNAAHLGCYVYDDPDETLFPLTISPELPVYLVAAKPTFREDVAERAGLLDRATQHGVADRLLAANLLPHGGGYRYPHLAEVVRVRAEGPDARRFELRGTDGSMHTIEHPRGEPYVYRSDEVLRRMQELEQGEPVVEMRIQYILREAPA